MDTKTVKRRYDLDWLRVLAFTAVFFYHSSRFFDESWWHIKNSTTSPLVDTLKGIFDLWGMPLIFMISGASIFFALRPGGAIRFLRDRGGLSRGPAPPALVPTLPGLRFPGVLQRFDPAGDHPPAQDRPGAGFGLYPGCWSNHRRHGGASHLICLR